MAASTHAVGRAATAFQPLAHSGGGNLACQTVHYSLTADASAGDTFQMIKIPNGATIVDLMFEGNSSDAFTYTVGDGVDPDRFIASASISAAASRGVVVAAALPYRYSLSANADPQHDTIDVVLTAVTATVALDFQLTVFYLMDGQVGQ